MNILRGRRLKKSLNAPVTNNLMCNISYLHFLNPRLRTHLLILETKERRERERNINVRKKHRLLASNGHQTRNLGMCPDQGLNM